jgi:hypothetical protein
MLHNSHAGFASSASSAGNWPLWPGTVCPRRARKAVSPHIFDFKICSQLRRATEEGPAWPAHPYVLQHVYTVLTHVRTAQYITVGLLLHKTPCNIYIIADRGKCL